MSNISQFFKSHKDGINGGAYNRREVYVGPFSTTWTAGSAGNVEVCCWGGGGDGGSGPGFGGSGGGGGGYVRYIYNMSVGDELSIVVGGSGESSSVSCPTQAPISPISATAGSVGVTTTSVSSTAYSIGGAGGVGTGTVPAPRTGYLLTRTGGRGNGGMYNPPSGPHVGGGGGSAGNEYGDGSTSHPGNQAYSSGGNGIGGNSYDNVDPSTGGPGNWPVRLGAPSSLPYTPWFYSYEIIGGNGGNGSISPGVDATPGGFLAGGGGGQRPPAGSEAPLFSGAPGGYAGGGGGQAQDPGTGVTAGNGGVGLVIVYYLV